MPALFVVEHLGRAVLFLFDRLELAPIAKDCAVCRLANCGLEFVTLRFRNFRHLRSPVSSADSE
eukprot:1346529-Alexandrium_andersonii.AAC.1